MQRHQLQLTVPHDRFIAHILSPYRLVISSSQFRFAKVTEVSEVRMDEACEDDVTRSHSRPLGACDAISSPT